MQVDYAASVDETVLDALNVLKGGRRWVYLGSSSHFLLAFPRFKQTITLIVFCRVIGVEERARVMEVLQGYDSQV